MAAICAAAPQLAARAAVSGYVLDRARARVSRTQTRWFGKCVTSDARATRVVAIGLPPGRGPSRARDLVTDRAIPIPCSECNSKFSAKAQKKARVAFRVRAAVRSDPRSNGIRASTGRFRVPVARLPGARLPATSATHESTPRRSRRSLSARAHRSVRSPPRPRSRTPQDEAAPAEEKKPEEKKPEPIGPPRGSQVRLSPRRARVSFATHPLARRATGNASTPHPGTDHADEAARRSSPKADIATSPLFVSARRFNR